MNHQTHDTKNESVFGELFRFAVIALIIVLPIRLFIAQPFLVSGASMEPTFENGDYLIVDQISYELNKPERGDVIIFQFPKDPSRFFIKRIIGLPGETLQIANNTITVADDANQNGIVLREPYLSEETATYGTLDITLGDDEYFVLGDNRTHSSDSRIWGPVPADLITGRALLRLFPVSQLDLLPGHYEQVQITE